MRKMVILLLIGGVLMLGTISAVAGSSEESQPKDITYPLFSDEGGDNSTLCGGGSDGGGGAPG